MRILSRPIIMGFIQKYPPSASSLNDWYSKTIKAKWQSFNDIKSTFNTVDFIGNDRYVFDISGNNYRLIAMIHFKTGCVYIRGIMLHKDYTQQSKTGKLNSL